MKVQKERATKLGKDCLPMEALFLRLSILLFFIALFQMHGYDGCLLKERIGLLEINSFFISITDKVYKYNIPKSWVDDPISNCCDWERIKCNVTTGRVIQLSLQNMIEFDISGGTPSLNLSLFLPFQELQSLDLSGNSFQGGYDNRTYDSFGSLKQLKILNLGFNRFNDSLLPYLTSITSLTTLILRSNSIEGSKTKELANLRKLQVLDLAGNPIQSDSMTRLGLANLRNLKILYLSEVNEFIGGLLSQELANLTNLEVLDLSGNSIGGNVAGLGICELKNLIELDLSSNNFDGHLPLCLSNLTYIKVLDLSYNKFTGNLAPVIYNLTALEYLSLLDNNFEGSFSFNSLANHSKLQVFKLSNSLVQIETEAFPRLPKYQLKALNLHNCSLNAFPSFLPYQYDLRFLDLSHSKLAGTFPTWLLQNNPKLDTLYLSNNSFSGYFQLPNSKHDLLHLDISHNILIGRLPGNIGKILPELRDLNMSRNGFEGSIPSSFGEMKSLQSLDLSSNNFSGELPRLFLSGCFPLYILILSDNNFQGELLFLNYMNLIYLRSLYLNNNQFSGKIQDALSKATSLVELNLSNNMLSGQIPHWIGNLSRLLVLLMSNNFLEGNFPVQVSRIHALQVLDISENKLHGSIPSSFNSPTLKHLYMHKNAFNGSILDSLGRSLGLTVLDLRDNQFSGSFPHWINEYSGLEILLLRGNHLQGNVPNQFCHLTELSILDLSYNKFNGPIPACFTNMTLWTQGRDAASFPISVNTVVFHEEIESYYNSTLELRVRNVNSQALGQRGIEFMTKKRYETYGGDILNYMTGLDLSCNQLTGNIPSEIGNLQKIRALNFSHNFLSGSIPEKFSNLKMIESLDLSHNNLSGRIPPQLIALNFLSNFNVSSNNLSGPTPNSGQFANFDEQNYGGNPGLCGPRINKSCTPVPDLPEIPSGGADEEESAVDMVTFYWSFGGSCVTVILGFLVILWVNSYWRRLWFYFIDACIDLCYYWLFKYVFKQ